MSASLPALPGVEHRFVRAGGVRLHYAEAGAGEPVVLVHGWPQHWFMWRRVIPLLAERHRLIAVDLRGFGWSDAPDTSYAKEELAGDLIALVEALSLEGVRLVGHDWGGFAAFLACLRAPERFRSLLAVSIIHPWLRPGFEPRALVAVMAYQPLLATPVLGVLAQRRLPLYRGVFRLGGGSRLWSQEERATFAAQFREPARARAASRLYRTFLTRELPAILRGRYRGERLRVPATLLAGRGDPVLSEARLAGAERHADQLTVEWVDGGHFLPEERPELVARRVV